MILNRCLNKCRSGVVVALIVAASSLFQAKVAFATDSASARKELQQMAIDYTETQFAASAGAGDMLAVKLFLDAGMDVNAGGSAALGLAAGRGQLEIVKLLLANGAKPTANALQFARTRGHKEIEDILVQAGAKE
ncbi:ankyrin repeat domain-containing protein [Methylomonas rosea]|uniref:Ankyrin repeat domain-containing protein n=1 Tax=Methylomonas rosea TaxID=2952227 RepID=A0ABT1TTK8_9GAMM|nr:ankyrin repeat domain-containing protein [Methylomonas sp. WSC-7]MCQ8118116.1 ankyrin repeat domain-containing protein [Methylomonas sp. WSC-7]